MTTNERRAAIIDIIQNADSPIPAKELASRFQVSRQVIVQDMAVIRASVSDIFSTNRGYIIQSGKRFAREFKVRHGQDRVADELKLIVDYGGTVKNVSISHTVYGRISADLEISSRQDVNDFMERIGNSSSTLLGSATSGYHYHLVEASNNERLDMIEEQLEKEGFLVPYLPWEKE